MSEDEANARLASATTNVFEVVDRAQFTLPGRHGSCILVRWQGHDLTSNHRI